MVVGVQLQPSAPAFARAPSTALAGRQGRECQFVVVAIRLSVCCSHIVKVVELFLCVA